MCDMSVTVSLSYEPLVCQVSVQLDESVHGSHTLFSTFLFSFSFFFFFFFFFFLSFLVFFSGASIQAMSAVTLVMSDDGLRKVCSCFPPWFCLLCKPIRRG